jgi:hypothetical protein
MQDSGYGYPCKVELKDGRTLDNVYIEPEEPYLRT